MRRRRNRPSTWVGRRPDSLTGGSQERRTFTPEQLHALRRILNQIAGKPNYELVFDKDGNPRAVRTDE